MDNRWRIASSHLSFRPQVSSLSMHTLLTAAQLSEGIDRLARDVRQAYGDCPLTVVGVLTGSVVVVSDLIRRLEGPVRLSMVWASSYRGTATRAGRLDLRLDLLPDLTGQHVLLVDDIFDSGRTMDAILADLRGRGRPACGRLCFYGSRAGQRCRSSPTLWASTSPTCSSWATASTTTVPGGTCPMSPSSMPTTSPRVVPPRSTFPVEARVWRRWIKRIQLPAVICRL